MKYSILTAFFLLPFTLFAHGSDPHSKDVKNANGEPQTKVEVFHPQQINSSYLTKVKPIFRQKCFDCHGDQRNYPWYFKIPMVQQLIERDIATAKSHIDLSNDFPFGGHGKSSVDDLESLQGSIQEKSMPPLLYALAHQDSRLTEEERLTVLSWIKESKQLLKNNKLATDKGL